MSHPGSRLLWRIAMPANRSPLRILSHHRLYDLIRAHPSHLRRTPPDGLQEFWDDFIRLAQQAVQVGPALFATLFKPQPVALGGVK